MGLAGRGHELRLLSAHGLPGELPDPARVVGWQVPVRSLRYASASGAVRQEIRSFLPDVTVAHFLPNYGFLAALAGAAPFLLVCWGSDLLVNATRTPFHRARARWTLHRAGSIHVDARNLEAAAVHLGADKDRVWVRPWGVDVDRYAPGEGVVARRAPGEPIRVLWTRQLEPIYDPSTLIRALGLLARKGIPFRATLAGSGPMRASLESLARDEGVFGWITFTGWVDEAELPRLYAEHDAYVSLSLSDSTSQSLLEAMAAGLVPVVTDIAGNREWVRHRAEGLLVPTGDAEAVACALAEVARDPGSASAWAARARAEVVARGRFQDTMAETERRLAALAEAHGGGEPAWRGSAP